MKLQGNTKIEFFRNGKAVQTIEKHNMLTNFMRDFMSLRFPQATALSIEDLVGGIAIFDRALPEDPDEYGVPEDAICVGHAAVNTLYTGADDLTMGSFNEALSDLKSTKSRTYVYDFTTQ